MQSKAWPARDGPQLPAGPDALSRRKHSPEEPSHKQMVLLTNSYKLSFPQAARFFRSPETELPLELVLRLRPLHAAATTNLSGPPNSELELRHREGKESP
jgi:hypothetical protein